MDGLERHRKMFAERARYLASFPPDNLLRKEAPPAPPAPSLPPMELSEEGAQQMRRMKAMREIEAAMRAEAEVKPKPLALSMGTIFSRS